MGTKLDEVFSDMQGEMESETEPACYAGSGMARKTTINPTARDLELFASLYRDPKTAQQLFQESQAYQHPFHSLSRLQVRLRLLCEERDQQCRLRQRGFLRRWRYHDNTQGSAPFYYKLNKEGFRYCFGADVVLPTKRFLDEVNPYRHRHIRALADCNIHTFITARRHDIALHHFSPENTLRVTVPSDEVEETLVPDTRFDLIPPTGRCWRIYQELDCSTETKVATVKRSKTWEETILKYEQLHYQSEQPFRVFLFFTESRQRCRNVLELAGQLVRNKQRRIFFGIYLPDYLSCPHVFSAPIFLDQNLQQASLLPASELGQQPRQSIAPQRITPYSKAPDRQTIAVA